MSVIFTISAAIGISSVAVAILLVNAEQNTAMHVTRRTVTGCGRVSKVLRNDAIDADKPEAYNTIVTEIDINV